MRKGSSSDSTSYDPDLDYYQPITVRIACSSARQLEALRGTVAVEEECKRYMDDVMDGATRAEYVLLAMRLPKDVEPIPNAEKADEERERSEQASVLSWATTDGAVGKQVEIKAKMARKVPSEEEQYHSFINSVREVV